MIRLMFFGLSLVFVEQVAAQQVHLNTFNEHLDVELVGKFPKLVFYDNPKLSGKPVVELTEQGLYIDQKLACTWPDGKFRLNNNQMADGMVIGFSHKSREAEGFKFTPCPKQQPVRSLVGDGGVGVATLYVEYENIDGDLLKAKLGSKTIFLSLKSLPAKYILKPANSLRTEPGC